MPRNSLVDLLHQMVEAINNHDLTTLVSLFHPDYESTQPVHPERSVRGRDQVADNWAWVFDQFDDFEAEVMDFSIRDCTIWIEWNWHGTNPNGVVTQVRGVMILTSDGELFRTGRLYLEPVQ